MAQTFDHLHTGVWPFLDESQEERITRLYTPKWVWYAGASEALLAKAAELAIRQKTNPSV